MNVTEHRIIVFPNDEKSKALAERTEQNFKDDQHIYWATHLDMWPDQCVLTLTANFTLTEGAEDEKTEEAEALD